MQEQRIAVVNAAAAAAEERREREANARREKSVTTAASANSSANASPEVKQKLQVTVNENRSGKVLLLNSYNISSPTDIYYEKTECNDQWTCIFIITISNRMVSRLV